LKTIPDKLETSHCTLFDDSYKLLWTGMQILFVDINIVLAGE
jgi:hypothetical protein